MKNDSYGATIWWCFIYLMTVKCVLQFSCQTMYVSRTVKWYFRYWSCKPLSETSFYSFMIKFNKILNLKYTKLVIEPTQGLYSSWHAYKYCFTHHCNNVRIVFMILPSVLRWYLLQLNKNTGQHYILSFQYCQIMHSF